MNHMSRNKKLVSGILISTLMIGVLLLFSIPTYQTSVTTGCTLHGGTVRRSLIRGDSKEKIQQEIDAAKRLDSVVDCAGPSRTTTFKLYAL